MTISDTSNPTGNIDSSTGTNTALGTVEHIDPNLIVVEANVRTETTLPREFVASIKNNGVLTPILARRDTHGTVIVRAGQRRTLAAREAGLATIPVYIVEANEATTARERVRAVFGLSSRPGPAHPIAIRNSMVGCHPVIPHIRD